ncbi:MAG: family 16 glycosylhydrolase [Chloroherpetonaceae bacterium]|nr:family 16 glycosylhydrolase [Chloroherpetonaceae bacterium]
MQSSRMKTLVTIFAFFLAINLYAQIPTTGLQLWLRADTLALADGDSVSLWPDLSGGNRNATSTGSFKPIYVTNQVNGKPAVRFQGTSGFSSSGSAMTVPMLSGSNISAFVVVANRRAPLVQQAVDVILASKTSGDPNQFTGFGFSTYNGFASTASRTLIAEASGNGSTVRLRRNGQNAPNINLNQNQFVVAAYIGSGIINQGVVNGQTAGTQVRLGSFVGETQGLYGTNDIAEVLLYNRTLNSVETVAVEKYLSEKYNITVATEPVAPPGGGKFYRGAEYRTKESFLYGRFEVRMKSVPGSGVLSTFFTYHDFVGSTEQWNEIDIEILGRYNNEVQFNVITAFETSHDYRQVVNFNPHQDFHDYAFEWTPTYVAWFVDGVEVYRQTQAHILTLRRAQKIMMNIWQPIWTDWTGTFDWRILPLYPAYEWVRYSSWSESRGFTFSWQDNLDSFDSNRWDRGTGTWSANNAQFTPDNIFFQNGRMFLGLTMPEQAGQLLRIDRRGREISRDYELMQNFPNPFNPTTTIRYQLPEISRVQLDVYDLLGRKVETLVNTLQSSGRYDINFNASSLASGVYFYRLSATPLGGQRGFIETRKMTLIK